jgi:hypothetical protein
MCPTDSLAGQLQTLKTGSAPSKPKRKSKLQQQHQRNRTLSQGGQEVPQAQTGPASPVEEESDDESDTDGDVDSDTSETDTETEDES